MLIFQQVERLVFLAWHGESRGLLVVFTQLMVDFERASSTAFPQTSRLSKASGGPPEGSKILPMILRNRNEGGLVVIKSKFALPAKKWRARRESNPRPSA
jgi:hypothetical protein